MWTLDKLAAEAKVSTRTLRRMAAKGYFPQAPRGGGGRISLDHRVLVLAAMKMRSEGTSLKEFKDRLPGLSRAQLFKIAGVPLPDDLLPTPPPPPAPVIAAPPPAPVEAPPQMLAQPLPPPTSAPAARVWLRLPISDGVELHVAMGAVEGRTLEAIVAALRPLTAQR